jgi:hypothetical protein
MARCWRGWGRPSTIASSSRNKESDLLDPDRSTGRGFVPAQVRQMDENGESVVAADLVSGLMVGRDKIPAISPRGKIGKLDGKSLGLDTIRLVAKCLN